MKIGGAGESDGWGRAWGRKRAKFAGVFSIKEACKGDGGKDRGSETSPQHLIFQDGGNREIWVEKISSRQSGGLRSGRRART